MRERGLSAEATRAWKVLSEVDRLAKDAQVALRGSGMEEAWLRALDCWCRTTKRHLITPPTLPPHTVQQRT